jgi:hypothetical protein
MDIATRAKLDRLDRTIEAQKQFLRRVPDPDNRTRAEANLLDLVHRRDETYTACHGRGEHKPRD